MHLRRFTIKKDKHRSGLYFAPYLQERYFHWQVSFDPSCIYSFNDVDDYDINKLCGVSFGYHHNNSVRYGWRAVGNKIELSAYIYENKERIMESIGLVDTNKFYNIKLFILDDKYVFKIYDNGTLLYTKEVATSKKLRLGYHLFPYFGGNRTAPHAMCIVLDKLDSKSFKLFESA